MRGLNLERLRMYLEKAAEETKMRYRFDPESSEPKAVEDYERLVHRAFDMYFGR